MNRFTTFFDKKLNESFYYCKHKSGLDVYVFPKKMTLKTALLGVRFGSVYEEGAEVDGKILNFPSGIAHFLEHKLFSSADGVDAAELMAALGADTNAYTSNNKTVYMFSCTENFDESLASLIDFVYSPYFTDENVESEKGIITQEIKMCLDSPYDVVSQNLLLALYGKGKLSSDVLGTEDTVKGISAQMLYDCYRAFYRPSNMALVVSGDVDCSAVLDIVDEHLIETSSKPPILPVSHTERGACQALIERKMPVGMPIFEIGIKDDNPPRDAVARLRRDVALTVLDEMLFSRAGELYNELFESGMINESYTYGYSTTRDVAFHSIYGEGENPQAVLSRVKEYIKDVKERGLSERDFVRCKRVMQAEFIRDFDSVDDVANSLLNLVFEGSDSFEYRKIIEELTFSDVCELLYNAFDEERFTISIIKNQD